MNSSKETNKQRIYHIEKMYDSKKKKKDSFAINYIFSFNQIYICISPEGSKN